MEKYLNTPIKEVITKFPKVADILNEYKIGCVPCNVGSCLLKDIVEIHNLTLQEEGQLMRRIAQVIYPGKEIEIPKLKRKPPATKGLKYSPPIKRLVDEHVLIKKWLGLIPEVIKDLDPGSEEAKKIILGGVDFIRSYADKYHHAKEEEILFKYFDENLDIIKTMLVDHDTARNHVKLIMQALQNKDKKAVIEHLNGYKDLLTEHIKKEDEILYPWIDRNLSTKQVGELFAKFNEANNAFKKEVIARCEEFVKEMEERTQEKTKRRKIK